MSEPIPLNQYQLMNEQVALAIGGERVDWKWLSDIQQYQPMVHWKPGECLEGYEVTPLKRYCEEWLPAMRAAEKCNLFEQFYLTFEQTIWVVLKKSNFVVQWSDRSGPMAICKAIINWKKA